MPVPTKWVREGIKAGFVMPDGIIRAGFVSQIHDENSGVVDIHVLCHPDDPQFSTNRQDGPVRIATCVRYSGNDPQPGTWHYLHGRPPAELGLDQGITKMPGYAPQAVALPKEVKIVPDMSADLAKEPLALANVSRQIMYGANEGQTGYTSESVEYDVLIHMDIVPPRANDLNFTAIVWMPLEDANSLGNGNLPAKWIDSAVRILEAFIDAGKNVILQSYSGHSRTGLLDIAYHMKKNKWSRDEAMSMIRAVRACNPNPYFLRALQEYGEHLIDEAKVKYPLMEVPGAASVPGAQQPVFHTPGRPRPFGS